MRPGDTIILPIYRQTAAGAASTGKVLADFTIPAYLDGVSTAMGAAITEDATQGNWREYNLSITLPSTAGYVAIGPIQAASGTDIITPDQWAGEIEADDIASLAAAFQTSQGIPGIQSAADSSLGDIVDGDSYQSATLTMPAGKLSPSGISDISAVGITVEAAIMLTPGGTSYPITATVVSGVGLTFNLSWTTQQHPALAAGVFSTACFIDVQVIKTGPPKLIITTNRYTFTQVWQRDTRTA